jgi:endonuclease/exonuclease/phosphatase (EEP) superfamily protein YafD
VTDLDTRRAGAPSQLLAWSLGLLGVASLFATLEGFHWTLDLAVHYRPHLIVLWGIGGLACIATRGWKSLGFAVAWSLVLASGLGRAPAPPFSPHAGVHLMHVNVEMDAPDHGPLIAQIKAHNPDVLSLVEVDAAWMESFARELDYPHVQSAPRPDFLGLALLSKYPIRSFEVVELSRGVPVAMASLAIGTQTIPLTILHVLPPITPMWVRSRAETLTRLATQKIPATERWVVCGDFNATPWSRAFRNFAEVSGLSPVRYGGNYEGSWPAFLPYGRLPIDHCLLGPDLAVSRASLGEPVAGDHLPLHLHFSIPNP